jgi:hypothetical protein
MRIRIAIPDPEEKENQPIYEKNKIYNFLKMKSSLFYEISTQFFLCDHTGI